MVTVNIKRPFGTPHSGGSSYLDSLLLEHELVVHTAKLHWVIFNLSGAALLTGYLILQFKDFFLSFIPNAEIALTFALPVEILSYIFFLIGGLLFLFTFIRYISTELVVTDQHVYAKKGFLSINVFGTPMSKITNITIDQSVFGRLLGYGTVNVNGHPDDLPSIDHIADPYLLFHHVMQGIQETTILEQMKKQVAEAPAPIAPAPPPLPKSEATQTLPAQAPNKISDQT